MTGWKTCGVSPGPTVGCSTGTRGRWSRSSATRNPAPGATRISEVALAILSRAGFTDERVVATFSGLIALNYGWSAFASARDVQPAAAGQVRAALAALPRAEYTRTAAVAEEMADYGSDRHYELVVGQLLAGIRAAARSTA